MKVLIIGGRGYIGSKLQLFFEIRGVDVTVYGSRRQDYNDLSQEFIRSYDVIILLAGHSSVPSCNGDLKSPWNNNVRNFYNLIEKTSDDQKIIYASSSSVYGNTGNEPATENFLCSMYVNNYDLTKVVLDMAAASYINKGKQIVGLRFGTVNGVSPVIRRELLVNSMTYSAVTTGKIQITNADIIRPYLDIYELSRAVYTIIREDFIPGIYNLASGNMTIREYASVVSEMTDAEIVDNGTTQGVYNFSISSKKFEKTYSIEIQDNLRVLVEELVDNYVNKKSTLVTRNEYFNYEG